MTKPLSPAIEIAELWEAWCGWSRWSCAARMFGRLGGKIEYWCGVPQSASAIPLTFGLARADGSELPCSSRLSDIESAVRVLLKETGSNYSFEQLRDEITAEFAASSIVRDGPVSVRKGIGKPRVLNRELPLTALRLATKRGLLVVNREPRPYGHDEIYAAASIAVMNAGSPAQYPLAQSPKA